MFGLGHQKPRHYKGDQVRCGGRTLFAALGVRHVSSAARGRRRFARPISRSTGPKATCCCRRRRS